MNSDTSLLRQIHPKHVKDRKATSQAFTPRLDEEGLSTYDGDMISAEESWIHYTHELSNSSSGVLALTVEECTAEQLKVYPKADGHFDEHVIVAMTRNKGLAKRLRKAAMARGWQYPLDGPITSQ